MQQNRFLAALAVGTALVMAGPVTAQTPLQNAIEGDYGYLQTLYTHLHENPELSFEEKQTAKRIAKELRSLGFEVTTGIGGTGLVAVMKNGDGPTVMIRTDLDALPVKEQTGKPYASTVRGQNYLGDKNLPIMHACGHDVHMTALVGTARRLVAMKDQWAGTLVMIGQPAEELGLGAKAMLEDGLFSRFPKPDYNLGLHVNAGLPAGTIGYTSGYALANVDSVDIEIKGVGGHGAYPQATKDPIVLGAYIVTALQTLVSREIDPQAPAVVTVGSFHGGTKHNIIPDSAHLKLTVRSYSDEVREKLLHGITRIAQNQARAFGLPEDKLPVVTKEENYTPSLYNDPALVKNTMAAIAKQIGADNIRELKPVMGGEDFSRYGRTKDKIPGFMFWVGAVNPDVYAKTKAEGGTLPSLHSPFFAPDPRRTIITAVDAMSTAALNLLGKSDG
ncbi:MAG: amidohydrolase [Robiginitomaculum sp.]|nr:amidohydrolase [Robiginitomaculum sp.]MDQ7077402.1 amidohydrolase [Robiginitomaculum sp.]